jgi:hypothetical protein
MSIDFETLDEVSRDFATFVAERRPDWLVCARLLPNSEGSDLHHLEIEFANPAHAEAQELLWISTYGSEITIGVGDYHAHFPWPVDYNGEDGRPAAMRFLNALMSEEVVVVSFWDGSRMRSSSSVTPEHVIGLNDLPEALEEIRIWSWLGTYSRTVRSDWQTYLKLIDDNHSSVFRPVS